MAELEWLPIEKAPYDELVIVKGPSGMRRFTQFICLAFRQADYHNGRWQDVDQDDLSDHGWEPSHFLPRSALPE